MATSPNIQSDSGSSIPSLKDQMELVKLLREGSENNREFQRSEFKEQLDIIKFLTEESERNREAQRKEAEANRQLFIDLGKMLGIFLTILIAVASFLFVRNVSDLNQDMRTRAEKRDKEEKDAIDVLKTDFSNAKNDLTSSVGKAIQTIDSTIKDEVQKRVNDDKQINAEIDQALKGAVTPKIVKEVQNEAKSEVANVVHQSIGPQLEIQKLIQDASEDNATAFDHLLKRRSDPSLGVEDQRWVDSAIDYRRRKTFEELPDQRLGSALVPPDFNCQQFPDDASKDARTRADQMYFCLANLMALRQGFGFGLFNTIDSETLIREINLIPKIVTMASDDHSLLVRADALNLLHTVFEESKGFPPTLSDALSPEFVKAWWQRNMLDFRSLAALSIVQPDAAVIYDLLNTFKKDSTPDLQKRIEQEASKMERDAATQYSPPQSQTVASCEANEGQLQGDSAYAAAIIPTIVPCKANSKLIPTIVDLALHSRWLSARYSATRLLNAWLGTSLKPFDGGVEKWWEENEPKYKS